MHPAPASRTAIGTTFLTAMSLLGLLACVQVALLLRAGGDAVTQRVEVPQEVSDALLMDEAARAMAKGTPTVTMEPSASATKEATLEAAEKEAAILEEALAQAAVAQVEKQVVAGLPRPTPVPVRQQVTPETRVIGLVNLARTLRDRGDTSTALTRLREAQVIFPSHPLIISEMAITYEKMELTDKAVEQWRRIYEFGERAGIYYAAAEAKMRALRIPIDRPAFQIETPVEGGLWEQAGAEAQAGEEGGRGVPALLLGRVGTTNDTGNSQPFRKLTLRVPIFARPGQEISVEDVTIQVFFYDELRDGTVVETNADVSYDWVPRVGFDGEQTVDWSTSQPEVLDASYAQPEPDSNDPGTLERRKYFGYVVRVYYKGALNATNAEPIRLLSLFPPPQSFQPSDLPQ